jgi:hypothetical protein
MRPEAANLKVAKIDSSRMVIRIEQVREAAIATSCCRRSCSASYVPIGALRGPRTRCDPNRHPGGHCPDFFADVLAPA